MHAVINKKKSMVRRSVRPFLFQIIKSKKKEKAKQKTTYRILVEHCHRSVIWQFQIFSVSHILRNGELINIGVELRSIVVYVDNSDSRLTIVGTVETNGGANVGRVDDLTSLKMFIWL